MPAMTDPNDLAEIALFRDVTAEQLSWLNDHLHLKTFSAGSNIVTIEQPGEIVYIILSGTVKIFVEQMAGSEVVLNVLGPGDTVGELSLFDSAGRSANVVTLEETTLLWMDRATFWECIRTMPSVSYEMVHIVCDRLRLANDQIQALASLDIYGRVARQILALGQRYGRATGSGKTLIPIRLTQSDIAGMVGASRERVNQVIMAYKQRHYISVDRNYRITIHDQPALIQRCQ